MWQRIKREVSRALNRRGFMWTTENVAALWRARSIPDSATCPACERRHVALIVSEGGGYKWSCVDCGRQSPLFFVRRDVVSGNEGLRVEGEGGEVPIRIDDETPSGGLRVNELRFEGRA